MKRRKPTPAGLLETYKTLAARADKRLQRLEKYSRRSDPTLKGILKGAYARAMKDIERYSGKGHKRFSTKPRYRADGTLDVEFLQAKINDIQSFLRADTSTLKPGIDTQGYAISVYEKQAKTFNTLYGADLTWQELHGYYGNKRAQRIAARISASKSVAQAVGRFAEMHRKDPNLTGYQLYKRLKENPDMRLDDDDVIDDIMKRMIRAGISPRNMFKKD